MANQETEKRLQLRIDLEKMLKEYYEACVCDDNYDFADDLRDIVWDATKGEIDY